MKKKVVPGGIDKAPLLTGKAEDIEVVEEGRQDFSEVSLATTTTAAVVSPPPSPPIVPRKELPVPVLLSSSDALVHMLQAAGPFTLSNLSLAAYTIGNGVVLQKLGDTAVASGPLMSTFAYSIFSTVNGILYATGILIGKLNGLAKTDPSKAAEIGSMLRRSWVIASLLVVPSTTLMLTSGAMLRAAGIEDDVAQEVQNYFKGISYGLLPIFLNFCDQQMTLAVGHKQTTLVSGTAYSAMAALFGYPLALGAFGLPKLGAAGIGYGASISGLISFLALRAYFLINKEYAEYGLFNFTGFVNKQDFIRYFTKDIKQFMDMGFPIGLQNLSEWGNLAVLSMLVGQLGSDVLSATQVSIIPISAFNVLILALAQATGVSVAESFGLASGYMLAGKDPYKKIALKNSKTLGYAGLAIGSVVSLLIAGLFIGIPNQISSLFLGSDNSDSSATEEDILDLAGTMLLINGIGLIIDTVRNIAGGGLRGYEDVTFVPIISFVMMSVLGLTVGGVLALEYDQGAESLFITRNVGMFLAAAAILYRFYALDPETRLADVASRSRSASVGSLSPGSAQFSTPKRKDNCYAFFNCFKSKKKEDEQPDDDLDNDDSKTNDI